MIGKELVTLRVESGGGSKLTTDLRIGIMNPFKIKQPTVGQEKHTQNHTFRLIFANFEKYTFFEGLYLGTNGINTVHSFDTQNLK